MNPHSHPKARPFPWPAQLAPTRTLATRVGICHTTLRTAARKGLTVWQADRLAIGIGLHPAMIWPDWFDGATEMEVVT